MKEPLAECCDKHQHNHHTEQHPGDIGSAELSDACHNAMIIVINKASRRGLRQELDQQPLVPPWCLLKVEYTKVSTPLPGELCCQATNGPVKCIYPKDFDR